MGGETRECDLVQPWIQSAENGGLPSEWKDLRWALPWGETHNSMPRFYGNDVISKLYSILKLDWIKSFWWKPCFPIEKKATRRRESDEYYIVRWSEQAWPFKYVDSSYSFKEAEWKPLYTAVTPDGYNVLMLWCDKIYRSEAKIEDVQEIWWKIFFAAYENWCTTLRRWDEVFHIPNKYIYSIYNIWEKPVIDINKGTKKDPFGPVTVMRWFNEKLWEFERVGVIEDLWKKPIFKTKDKWHTIPMRWFDKLWDFEKIYWNSDWRFCEMKWKPLYIATEHGWHRVLMRWSVNLWEIIEEDTQCIWKNVILELNGNENIFNLLWEGKSETNGICSFLQTQNESNRVFCIKYNGKTYVFTE